RTPAHPRPAPFRSGPPRITFRDVHVGYTEGEPVLEGFELDIPAGTSVALVGPSGSGKTTVLQLVARLTDPWYGAVELDGVPVRELDLRTLRAGMCMVFQQPQLFSASVRENVAMGGAAIHS